MRTIQSIINSVTVFSDRALILRKSINKLEKGTHKLVFDNLPSNIDTNSLQVNGFGNAIIHNVTTKSVNHLVVSKEEVAKLQNKKNELAERLEVLADNLAEIDKEKEVIEKITNKLTAQSKQTEEDNLALLEPNKWEAFISFNRAKNESFNTETRKTHKEIKQLNKEVEYVDNELNNLNYNQYKTAFQVVVIVEALEENDITLELNYVVFGPYWKPVYDIRVNSNNKSVKISYKANVVQNTSESWDNVKVVLSTAQPQTNTIQKELTPIYVDLKSAQPVFGGMGDRKLSKTARRPVRSRSISAKEEVNFSAVADDFEEPVVEAKRNIATVETNTTHVEFNISGDYTINNNNENHELTILINDFESKFFYSVIPKLEQVAYLKAEITNNTEFPLLPGVSNIFLDNAYVANSQIKLITPNENLFISLGIDPSIKVKYKFINKFFKKEGFVNKTNNLYFEYEILLENNKNTDEELIVKDQLAISSHENIKVELIEPLLEEGKDSFKKKEHETLEWTLKLKSKEKVKIPLKYSIEYPKDEEFIYK